ncbi:MAG: hypothetical protein JJD98_15510 [Polaromonas sp.]|nr:hypothetical protein [Polaromonas sp.]
MNYYTDIQRITYIPGAKISSAIGKRHAEYLTVRSWWKNDYQNSAQRTVNIAYDPTSSLLVSSIYEQEPM